MVSAPQHGQHLQNSQNAGANVEDVFQLGPPFLTCKGATEARRNQGVNCHGQKE